MEDRHSCYIQKLTKNTMTRMKHEHGDREEEKHLLLLQDGCLECSRWCSAAAVVHVYLSHQSPEVN
jgi:hypothetical protein